MRTENNIHARWGQLLVPSRPFWPLNTLFSYITFQYLLIVPFCVLLNKLWSDWTSSVSTCKLNYTWPVSLIWGLSHALTPTVEISHISEHCSHVFSSIVSVIFYYYDTWYWRPFPAKQWQQQQYIQVHHHHHHLISVHMSIQIKAGTTRRETALTVALYKQ